MKENIRRVLFAGSADFSMPTLRMLHEKGVLCAVLTSPDRPAGRGRLVRPNCVAAFAQAHGVPLLQPESLRSEAREAVARFAPQLMVCAAYGKIFGQRFLGLFERGAVNVHPSLLPRFRGPAPVPASILAGDARTGVTLQRMSLAMDEGDVLLQTQRDVGERDDSEFLLASLAEEGAEDVERFIENSDELYEKAVPQNNEAAVYCTKLSPAYGRVCWMERAEDVVRIARAFSKPYWGARAYYEAEADVEPQALKLWRVHLVDKTAKIAAAGTVVGCDEQHGVLIQAARGVVGCTELQLPNRKKLFWKDFVQGEPHIIRSRLC